MAEVVSQVVTFPSAGRPPLTLVGELSRIWPPSGQGLLPGVALCHPQPAATSMDDPLVRRLAADLAATGFLALRFNFRGVGASEGQQSDGRLEPLDIAGAVEFLLSQSGVNPAKICLVGHAFGGLMALTYASHDPRIGTVVAVSPPAFRITPELGAYERPKLIVTGEHDEVAPPHKLEHWLQSVPSRGLRVVSGARHLMRGYEDVAAGTIVQYLTRWAETPGV